MARRGLTPETVAQIEALVNALLDKGDAVINRGEQPPCDIKFARSEQPQGQIWLSVKTTNKGLCCLLDSSHSQKSSGERQNRQRELGDRIEALKKVGLLELIPSDTHNISRKPGTYFYLKLNLDNKAESQKVLRERLWPKNSLLADPLELSVDALVHHVRQQLNEVVQQQYGQVRVFGIPQPVKVSDIYTRTDVWREIINQRYQMLLNLRQAAYSSEHLSRLGNEHHEPERYSGWSTAENFKRLMVLGKPGIGKTTYLQYLSIQCINGTFQPDKIPIFVQLSQFELAIRENPSETLPNFIYTTLSRWGVDVDIVETILNAGRALLLFDGLDEVPPATSERVTNQLRQFIDQSPENSFIITCRVAANQYRFARENFTEIEVADLNREQADSFIRLWFEALLKEQPEAAREQAEKLIAILNQPKHRAIQDLAITPLLLNLVCILFRDTEELPSIRSQLYKQGINALLTDWDRHRQICREPIYGGLNKVHILKLLLKIGRTTFEQAHLLFEQRQAEWLISDYLESSELAQANSVELQEASTIVLKGIVAHHGLLIERANYIFSFSHLTYHEVFAAWSIHVDQAWQVLLPQICNFQWREVFLLVAEMQRSGDTLIRMMEQQIQDTFATQVELQRLLVWVNTKATKAAEELPYKLSALRAWYLSFNGFNLDEGIESFRKSGQATEAYYGISLAKTLGLDESLAVDLSEVQILYPRLCEALSLVANKKLTTDLISLFSRSYDKHFIDGLLPIVLFLKPLLSQLDNLTFPSQQNLVLNWWKQEGKRWTVEVVAKLQSLDSQEDLLSPQSPQQTNSVPKEVLRQYYDANLLLLDCIRRAASVSPTLQQDIENSLLLPSEDPELHV